MYAAPKAKTADLRHNVGRAKYCLTYYTGTRTHSDGSLAADIATFKNLKDLRRFTDSLKAQGYTLN